MWYYQPEKATVISIQKEGPMASILRMEVTVRLQRTDQEFSFFWTKAPTVVTSRSYGNKAPQQFETFWWSDDWKGREVFVYHSMEPGYAYMEPCK